MSSSQFLPLEGHRSFAPRPGGTGGLALRQPLRQRPFRRRPRPGPAPRAGLAGAGLAGTGLTGTATARADQWRAFACPLAAGVGWRAASAVAERVAVRPPGTVILDLAGSAAIEEADGTALCWLAGQLNEAGSRLWLAAAPPPVAALLAGCGLTGLHPTLRAAVLAVFAGLPGPGLVTGQVRDALTTPPEPLLTGSQLPGSGSG